MDARQIISDLQKLANPAKAKILAGFFKTAPGQYGYGDKFLGVVTPEQRMIAKKYFSVVNFRDIENLLKSPYHEHRLTALFLLTYRFAKADKIERSKIFHLYLTNTDRINNWDLVDVSAPHIVGAWLVDNNRRVLYQLAKSKHLWKKRIAIISTLYFIRRNQYTDTLRIAQILLNDEHDLIHKAVGWMLREVGKKNPIILEKFLKKYHNTMPRTMLRYSIEKLAPAKKKFYMNKRLPRSFQSLAMTK
ncbi:MAG: DNA alkylation repair protein [bacterium]|nr:DNA alkylation repair protein [bacterium]